MTSDNNNCVTEGGKNGEIVFEMRVLFAEVKNEPGASMLLLKLVLLLTCCWLPPAAKRKQNISLSQE